MWGWIAFGVLLAVVIVVVIIGVLVAAGFTLAFMPLISMCYSDPRQLEKDRKAHPWKHRWYDFCGWLFKT